MVESGRFFIRTKPLPPTRTTIIGSVPFNITYPAARRPKKVLRALRPFAAVEEIPDDEKRNLRVRLPTSEDAFCYIRFNGPLRSLPRSKM